MGRGGGAGCISRSGLCARGGGRGRERNRRRKEAEEEEEEKSDSSRWHLGFRV